MRTARTRLAGALPFLLGVGFVASLSAESLGELFARVKSKVAAGSYAEGLVALGEVEAEAKKPGNEKALAPLRPAAAFYRGICLAALGRPDEAKVAFGIFIAENPNRGIDRKMYPASVVAAFEEARKSRPGAGNAENSLSALMLSYQSTSAPSESASAPGPDWANGPVKYLLAEEEKLAFSRLSDDSSRTQFVALFWRARDPKPETPDNEFRREFARRVAFADENFMDGPTRGSLTDRGMVFVLLGPPTGVARRPISAAEDNPTSDVPPMVGDKFPAKKPTATTPAGDQLANWTEVWRYSSEVLPSGIPDRYVDFSFVFNTRGGYGKKVLQRDSPSIRALDAARPKPHAVD